jgi:hypothetical protein
MTRIEPVRIFEFIGQNVVSQISSHCFKDFFCYEKINGVSESELFSGLKLTNLDELTWSVYLRYCIFVPLCQFHFRLMNEFCV